MTAPADVIAAHQCCPTFRSPDEPANMWRCTACDWRGQQNGAAAHVVAALAAAGIVCVEVPSVAYKGPLDTDASAFRQVAKNLDEGYPAGGSNVCRAVSGLLRNVADALTDDERTTSEIRGGTAAARRLHGPSCTLSSLCGECA
ncbi:hypothetical protein O4215_20505 [Rhodococcus maanshanensis]|uniref:hypothetical protein n=1 Tax=Rhodococcus maanshanensis TaxID=183556 RepID=UPI0022B2C149|nr:hypothetical protein [Rhodococcus maanshanensis]MCZ4557946.1 hypothetical protein [Rhodococcus maanshanensis]